MLQAQLDEKTIRLYSNFSLFNGWDEIRKKLVTKNEVLYWLTERRFGNCKIWKWSSVLPECYGNSFWFTLKIKLLLSKQKSSTLQIYNKLAVIYIILLGSTFISFFLEAITFCRLWQLIQIIILFKPMTIYNEYLFPWFTIFMQRIHFFDVVP